MSSFLKMNQKFLSKSSWTLRGGGENNRSSTSNNRTGRSVFMSPTTKSGVPSNKLVIANGNSGNNNVNKKKSKQNQTPTSNTGGASNYHHLFVTRNDNGKQRNSTNNNQKTDEMKQLSTTFDVSDSREFSPSPSQLVNNSGHNLKQTKGMSHSITDLRISTAINPTTTTSQLTEVNGQTDEAQNEIRERRIDMYIAEIEMEPVYQLGSTLR